MSSGACFCTCGFHTGHIWHHDPTQSVSHVWSLGLPFRKCSHHRLHTKSSEMKVVVHMMQQLSSCLGPSGVEHQSSKGCLDGCRWCNFWGDITYFCILQPNSLGFLYEEVKLELGNCFFYTTWGRAPLFFSVYWSIAHSFQHSCDFSIRGFIFHSSCPPSWLWPLTFIGRFRSIFPRPRDLLRIIPVSNFTPRLQVLRWEITSPPCFSCCLPSL